MISSQALVESRTFSENFVVTSASSTSISFSRAFAGGIEVRAVAFEGVDGLGQVAAKGAGQGVRFAVAA